MRRFFIIISILLLMLIVYLMVINFNNYASINYLHQALVSQQQSGLSEHSGLLYRATRLSTYTFLVLVIGVFVGAGTVNMFLSAMNDKVKAYQRELEKTSISGSASASKVEVLEAKIKTLEKAFDTVIDERTKLEVQIKSLNAEIENLNKRG
ncbi:MAG: hypothetical protein E7Z87_00460 [Cyanobacteria bacterium SIG26]|nr:hypothetical protein [Cyanobacteria bacterium SIG26]